MIFNIIVSFISHFAHCKLIANTHRMNPMTFDATVNGVKHALIWLRLLFFLLFLLFFNYVFSGLLVLLLHYYFKHFAFPTFSFSSLSLSPSLFVAVLFALVEELQQQLCSDISRPF